MAVYAHLIGAVLVQGYRSIGQAIAQRPGGGVAQNTQEALQTVADACYAEACSMQSGFAAERAG